MNIYAHVLPVLRQGAADATEEPVRSVMRGRLAAPTACAPGGRPTTFPAGHTHVGTARDGLPGIHAAEAPFSRCVLTLPGATAPLLRLIPAYGIIPSRLFSVRRLGRNSNVCALKVATGRMHAPIRIGLEDFSLDGMSAISADNAFCGRRTSIYGTSQTAFITAGTAQPGR